MEEQPMASMFAKMVLTVFCLTFLTSFCFSQGKWQVAVEHTGDDVLGGELAYKIKEQINKSSFFYLVSEDDATSGAILIVRIVTMNLPTDVLGDASTDLSVCSFTITVRIPPESREYYCLNSVAFFGRNRIDDSVTKALSNILKVAEKSLGSSWKIKK